MFCQLFILFLFCISFFYAPRGCHKRNFVVYTMTIKNLNLKRVQFWPGRVCSGLISFPDHSLWRFLSGRISSLKPRVRSVTPARSGGSCGCDPRGGTSRSFGLSTEVVETILQHRAPYTRKLYALKWKLSLLGAKTASSTQSTAQLEQFWSSCRPVSPQG